MGTRYRDEEYNRGRRWIKWRTWIDRLTTKMNKKVGQGKRTKLD